MASLIQMLNAAKFLLYSPLNQGLKLFDMAEANFQDEKFLLYSPLNQGLKRGNDRSISLPFLSFYSTVH